MRTFRPGSLNSFPRQKQFLKEASVYEEIPTRPSHEAYDVMVEFASDVKDGRVGEADSNQLFTGKGHFGDLKIH